MNTKMHGADREEKRYYGNHDVTFLAALYMMEIASCVILKLSAESPQLRALLHTLLHLSCVIHTVCTSLAGRSFTFIFCHSLVNKTHGSTALNWNSTCRGKKTADLLLSPAKRLQRQIGTLLIS